MSAATTEQERARRFDAPILAEVDSLRVVARHDATAERRRYDAGFNQGLEDGHRAAAADVEAAIADHRRNAERLAQLCSALDAAIAERCRTDAALLADIEQAVVETALRIAEVVVDRELADRSPIAEVISRSLDLGPRDEQVVVHLHPDDLACAAEALDAGLIRGAGSLDDLELVGDSSVGRGGCVVDAGSLHIDGRLSAAFERIAAELRSA